MRTLVVVALGQIAPQQVGASVVETIDTCLENVVVPEISCDALYQRLLAGEPMALIEALGADYFDDAHLPGALNMQPDRVKDLAPVLLPDRSILVVVYCSGTCAASTETAQRLVAMGYIDVVVFLGGKEEWVEAGLPVERLDS